MSIDKEFEFIIIWSTPMQSNQISDIPKQHRDATFQLMELLSMEMNEAYQLLSSARFSLDDAINFRMDPQSHNHGYQTRSSHNPSLPYQQLSHLQPLDIIDLNESPQKNIRNRNAKKVEEAQKKKYEKTYLIKKSRPKNKYLRRKKRDVHNLESDSKEKIEEQFNFTSALSRLIEGEVNVTFQDEIYDAFSKLWNERKLIAIHCIRFIDQHQIMPPFQQALNYTKEIYRTGAFIEVFNKYFINIGLDPSHIDFSHFSFLEELIMKGDQYSIILLRYDESQQKVVIFKKLPFSQTFKLSSPERFVELTKKIIHEDNQLKFNAKHKVAPMTESEKKRLQQDRVIRQEQEQQYYKHLNTINHEEEKSRELPKETLSKAEQRKNNRQALPVYPEDIEGAIRLKVRLPNSEILFYKLPRTETFQYLFQAIENSEKDSLGFEDEANRKFDIILPLERISLSEKKSETLQSVFGDSEMETLVVKEL